MKSRLATWGVTASLALFTASAGAQAPATSVTLFNSGRVLVRRTLPVNVPAGSSTQSLELGVFSPVSFALLDPGVTLGGIRFDPNWSEDALLRRSIGKHFQFARSPNGTATATLVALDPERWKWDSSGKVVFGRPGQIQWNVEQVPTGPVTDVTLRSERGHSALKVMYEVGGASWNAAYKIFLGPAGRIEGVASIGAGQLDLSDVEVQLSAGDIGNAMQGSPQLYAAKSAMAPMAERSSFADGVATNESVGEVHLYTLPGRLSFLPGIQFTVPLFDPTPARGEKRYSVSGTLPYYGGFMQQADESSVPVAVEYWFERKPGTPFGDLVLPGGGVALYEADNAGRLQLIGQGGIGHTPAGKELSIPTGTAFDITAKRVQTEYTVSRSTTTPVKTIVLAAFRVTLQNAKDSAVTVDVREDRGGEWSVVESSVPGQKRSSSRVVFPVRVPAGSTATLTYRVRVVW